MSRSHFLEALLKAASAGQRLVNERTGAVVASELELASDSRARNRGLLGRSGIADGAVMIIAPCNAIHTFFMRMAIDVAFLDAEGVVLRQVGALPPWRATPVQRGARSVLELPAGTLQASGTREGDCLRFEPTR